MPNKISAVVVLDLDDTLYKEVKFQESGLTEILNYLANLYGSSFPSKAKQIKLKKDYDWLGAVCIGLNLPLSIKESLLWVYRLHQPNISLDLGVQNLLMKLGEKATLAILTDGRSITQRNKIKALGLSHIPAYISEEYGAIKPALDGFELIMRELPANKYFYVGDNLVKDFIAPNKLGWVTICLRDDGYNVHTQNLANLSLSQSPLIWINTLEELLIHIC